MSLITAQASSQASLQAVVIRCKCGDPASHTGETCPAGQAEQQGTISFHHKDWRVRAAFRFLKFLGYRFDLWIYGRD